MSAASADTAIYLYELVCDSSWKGSIGFLEMRGKDERTSFENYVGQVD